jgi:hypothetical protein
VGDSLFKDAWATLTIAIPGLVTYGTWRLLLLFGDGWSVNGERLAQADDSAVLSTALIAAIAIVQQAVAISIEAVLGGLSALAGSKARAWQKLLLRRFKVAAKANLSDDARRTIGQFFLSLNVTVGLCGLLLYFRVAENLEATSPVAVVLSFAIVFALATCLFRAWAAKEVMP